MGKKREDLAIVAVLAVVYFGTAKLGLRFAFVNPSATALWAPTGIALAAFLIFGVRVWPGAFLAGVASLLVTVLRPSWPNSFLPLAHTVPSDRRARLNS